MDEIEKLDYVDILKYRGRYLIYIDLPIKHPVSGNPWSIYIIDPPRKNLAELVAYIHHYPFTQAALKRNRFPKPYREKLKQFGLRV